MLRLFFRRGGHWNDTGVALVTIGILDGVHRATHRAAQPRMHRQHFTAFVAKAAASSVRRATLWTVEHYITVHISRRGQRNRSAVTAVPSTTPSSRPRIPAIPNTLITQ